MTRSTRKRNLLTEGARKEPSQVVGQARQFTKGSQIPSEPYKSSNFRSNQARRMAKQNPEQEAFKHRDNVDDTQMDPRTLEALQLEVYGKVGNDKTTKLESGTESVVSPEIALAKSLAGIAERAARLPDDLRRQVVANNEGFIDAALLSVVRNPYEFKLGDQQNPQEVLAFLAKVQNG